MRRFLLAALLLPAFMTHATAAAPALALPAPSSQLIAQQRVLVLGDSITQDGRYVSFLEYYLHAVGQPADLISIGLSSETYSGLSEQIEALPRPCVLERLGRALAAVKPTVVIACYGMNDGIYHPPAPERLAAFRAGLHQFISTVRATGARLVLLTPPVFDPLPLAAKIVPLTAPVFGYAHPYAGYDEVLAEFTATELALAEPGVSVIDLHTPMARALAARRPADPTFTFSPDGVHPNELGHLLMGRLTAAGLGLSLPETALEAELARLKADPALPLVHERRQLRSEAWLSYVGFSHGGIFKSQSVTAAEQVARRLQAEIDATASK